MHGRQAGTAGGSRPAAGIPAREVLRDLEQRLVPGDVLWLGAAQEWLGSDTFGQLVRAAGQRHATDPAAEQARHRYGKQLEPVLEVAGGRLDSFECGPGYCVGEARGMPMPAGEDLLGDAVDAGAIVVRPWKDQAGESLRFILATDPAVREVTGG